jgi:hypothetical protein
MNLPITSRIKRSPLLATDPDEKAKATKINKGKKEIVKTSKDVKGAQVEKQATTPEEKAKYQKYLDDVKSGKVKRNTKYDDKKIETETEIDVPGDIISTDLYQDRKQKVLSNADVSNAQFATKRTTRNVNKAGNKLDRNTSKIEDMVAKYDKSTTDEDGNVVKADGKLSKEEYGSLSKGSFFGIFGNDRKKYDKLQREKDKYSSRVGQFKSANKNQTRSQESGRSWNDETKTTDSLKTKGQYGDKEQLKMKEDELAVQKAKAKEQGITGPSGGQASGAIEGVAVTAPVYNYSQENKSTPLGAPGKKKSPAYKMKGSMFQKRY